MKDTLSAEDLAIDQQLAQLSEGIRFLLEITPIDADDVRERFLAGETRDPVFTYRELSVDPDVEEAALEKIDVGAVQDTTLGHLLRAKHREMALQVDMLRARGTDDFRQLSVELYGGVSSGLLAKAQDILERVRVPEGSKERLDAEEFLALANEEIDRYRSVDPDVGISAEIRSDVSGVLCQADALIISDDASIFRERAEALIQHEVGTHGQLIANTGVLVVNDPASLANALSKAYFQHFPEAVRPKTLISRDEARIADFVEELGGKAVLKPLQGSGGSGVFMVNSKESPNLAQIIEAIARDGYVVAQEYLPEAKNGDVRMFLMNGRPLKVEGQYAAFRRRSTSSDIRSNISAGGKAETAEVTPEMLGLVDAVRPKLVADGMFLVGLDIVGDKLMEVNVFSPGGLNIAGELYGIDFFGKVVEDLTRKVNMRAHYGDQLSNAALATL